MSSSLTLNSFPQEVLEHIAYYTGASSFLGPPSAVAALVRCNAHLYRTLSINNNPHIYARIFAYKFDMEAPLDRLEEEMLTPRSLAMELKHRCIVLKRIRARTDSTVRAIHAQDGDDYGMTLLDVLSTMYIMMLENGGKNRAQLIKFAHVKDWLREYWFHPQGSSLAIHCLRTGRWLSNRADVDIGMWLFWFFLDKDDYSPNYADSIESPVNVLKVLALSAHRHKLTGTSWAEFEPRQLPENSGSTIATAYGSSLSFSPPPLAAPAILSFLSLTRASRSIPRYPSDANAATVWDEWRSEWGRAMSTSSKRSVCDSFRPGSIEGIWEGFFTYIDFTTYGNLLTGAPPGILRGCMLGQHSQAWKLREHHLLASDSSDSDSGIEIGVDQGRPLGGGDPLRSYFPTGTQIREHRDGLIVQQSDQSQVLRYRRASTTESRTSVEGQVDARVVDIIITGEGHSAWGQFNLVGRVRPCDGLVSLSKDYVDGDRGNWLYRGYLVGNQNANLSGRWRDTLSPADVPGYEGCFVMTRRR